jgi:hypothetical protein
MKRVNKMIYLKWLSGLLPIMILISCGSKTSSEMKSTSPDGKTTISVNGDKPSFGDPWQAKIKIKTSKDEKEVTTEIFAGELNNDNVKFIWQTNDQCRIVFSQQDDTQRNLLVKADSTQINLREE